MFMPIILGIIIYIISIFIYIAIIKWLFKEFWRAKYHVDAEQEDKKLMQEMRVEQSASTN